MSGIIDCEMHIGDEVFVHGYIDEIRNDTIIIRNVGGYFGTSRDEVFYYEEDERGYGTMNEADRKTESDSEKPNNCEHITEDGVTCAKYPACDDCLDNPLNKVKGSERLVKGSDESQPEPSGYKTKPVEDEPTSSKMEQVDKDINVRSKDEPQTDCTEALTLLWIKNMVTDEEFYRIDARLKVMPQTERSE